MVTRYVFVCDALKHCFMLALSDNKQGANAMWIVYYRGTSNIAVARIVAASARAAVSVAAEMVGTSSAYLQARRVHP
jgi:hypothetical protein